MATTTSIHPYHDSTLPVPERVEDLLARMTLDEKIGQVAQVEKNSISPSAAAEHFVGSILSGGGGYPADNTPHGWRTMIGEFQTKALQTRLGIPILYGVDAVHGHNNLHGAVIFPHSIGLGAAGDPALVERVARATAEELAATGVHWNFFPTVAVPQDIRWGRTYESYSENADLVVKLAAAFVRGSQGESWGDQAAVLANPKHYVGDGGTTWGTSKVKHYFGGINPKPGEEPAAEFMIDAGNNLADEATMRAVHLPPYGAALEAGAQIVMASFSSWQGEHMHGSYHWLTKVLKGELGFEGFVVSDWGGIDRLSPDYYKAVVAGFNAGLDMNMVPYDWQRFLAAMKQAVERGDIPMERLDDAVRRILRVKFTCGLFERPLADPARLPEVGSAAHRELAREAVARSLVLLKNEGRTLPLSKATGRIFVAGEGADDVGMMCGGWTIEWQGGRGPITPGTTILEAIRSAVAPGTAVDYDPAGEFAEGAEANAGIVVVGELPYAEGFGDSPDLSLSAADGAVIGQMRKLCKKLVVVVLSGRPVILTEQLPLMDALVAAWLPGTEGQGVADGLFGETPFTGKLAFTWPRSMAQVGQATATDGGSPLFPFGYGLA